MPWFEGGLDRTNKYLSYVCPCRGKVRKRAHKSATYKPSWCCNQINSVETLRSSLVVSKCGVRLVEHNLGGLKQGQTK